MNGGRLVIADPAKLAAAKTNIRDFAAARETRDRYERGLKAIARFGAPESEIGAADYAEWVVATVAALLDGQEAECPVCSTHVHEGACVGDGDEDADDENYDNERGLMSFLPECQACGDRRGTCNHSS